MQTGSRLETRDTIVALATPLGPAGRAIIRLSGPDARTIAASLFAAASETDDPSVGCLCLPGMAPWPAELFHWKSPRSYTGQDVVEIHTLSSPPLLEQLLAALLTAGARAAQPGEFTLRAFLAGKLDLTRAEAVLAVIEASDRQELNQALRQLAGGVAQPMQALRDDLLNLLADVEAGLDFADEDIQFVDASEMLLRIGRGLAMVTNLQHQLQARHESHRPFRVVLAGRPNAGKSSLFNALAGSEALVSPEPGTTRDYLSAAVDFDGTPLELIDTAGLRESPDKIEQSAQSLGREQMDRGDLVLLCVAADTTPTARELEFLLQDRVQLLWTKCDLAAPAPAEVSPLASTSVRTGVGIPELRRALIRRASLRREPPLAPSLSRCAAHVAQCLASLRRAHAVVLDEMPTELLALELREALAQLGQMVGAVYTEDLLDRIFSRFCIGK
jgi:tRNA modification GTPase